MIPMLDSRFTRSIEFFLRSTGFFVMESLEKLIAYLDIGKINLRLRGKKKTQLIAAMLEERQTAVRLVKSEGLKSRIPFRVHPRENT